MADTHIEWSDSVWNPTTGCDRVSPGCDNCYALTMAKRLKGMGSEKYQRDGDPRTSGPGFGLTSHSDVLGVPLRWRKPRRVFVNSMSDLFHDQVPDGFIAQVWAVMGTASRHTFQVLTKRHRRMRSLLSSTRFRLDVLARAADLDRPCRRSPMWPLSNVWCGVSVEDQRWADIRIPALLETPAVVRFLSCEPLLGPVDLSRWLVYECPHCLRSGPWTDGRATRLGDPEDEYWCQTCGAESLLAACVPPGLHWIIVGGESGPGARPMHPQWARDLRDQCVAAGVPFFFKQWGEYAPTGALVAHRGTEWQQVEEIARVGRKAAGRELDGRTWDEFPDQPVQRRAWPTPIGVQTLQPKGDLL